jgi:hypothetical protein
VGGNGKRINEFRTFFNRDLYIYEIQEIEDFSNPSILIHLYSLRYPLNEEKYNGQND